MDLNDQSAHQLQTIIMGTSNLGTSLVLIGWYYNLQVQQDNPFIELYFHYDLGGKNYLSPISFDE